MSSFEKQSKITELLNVTIVTEQLKFYSRILSRIPFMLFNLTFHASFTMQLQTANWKYSRLISQNTLDVSYLTEI